MNKIWYRRGRFGTMMIQYRCSLSTNERIEYVSRSQTSQITRAAQSLTTKKSSCTQRSWRLDERRKLEFQYGVMENFGLLIFRESCFLFKTGVTSTCTHCNCGITITHEIVRQWAGDWTSPKWYDSIWLKEGFVSMIPYIILDEAFP